VKENYYIGNKKYSEYPGRLRASLSIISSRMAKYSTVGAGAARRSSEDLFADFAEILEFARKTAAKEPFVARMLPFLEEAAVLMSPSVLNILKFLHSSDLLELSRIFDLYDHGANRRLELEDAFEPIARGDAGAVLSFYEEARATISSMRNDLEPASKLYAENQGRLLTDKLFTDMPSYFENLDRRLDALWVTAFLDSDD